MTVRSILIAGALGFLALLSVVFGVTFFAPADDALYINLAGRQRMLSQKASKEALAYLETPTAEAGDALDLTARIFESTHAALLGGGQAPSQLDGSAPVAVSGATDAELRGLLGQVGEHWKTLDGAITQVRDKAARRVEAIATLERINPTMLRKMDEAVGMMTAASLSPEMINIGGRQRMLSQKVVKDALLYDRRPSDEARATLTAMITLFETSHRALRHGGSVPLKLDGTVPTLIDGVGEQAAIAAQLDVVEGMWADHKDALTLLTDPANDTHPDRATIIASSLDVLKTMNAAVGRSQAVAEEKQAFVRTVNAAAVIGGLVLALLAVFVAFNIGGALRRLQRAAEEISTGKLDAPVPSMRLGEIRDLSTAFERMRTSLGQAMSMLGDDDEADGFLGG